MDSLCSTSITTFSTCSFWLYVCSLTSQTEITALSWDRFRGLSQCCSGCNDHKDRQFREGVQRLKITRFLSCWPRFFSIFNFILSRFMPLFTRGNSHIPVKLSKSEVIEIKEDAISPHHRILGSGCGARRVRRHCWWRASLLACHRCTERLQTHHQS